MTLNIDRRSASRRKFPRVLSSAVKMGDILESNVSVVEDLHKDRQPLPLVAVYFMQPNSRNVERLLQDYGEGSPPYPSVHVFFSSQVGLLGLRMRLMGPGTRRMGSILHVHGAMTLVNAERW